MRPIVLTIAGSDPSGGAGLQADLKTFHQHGVYGTSVVTLLTVQNTQRVSAVSILEPAFMRAQLDAVLQDVPPLAAKVGALGSAEMVLELADAAREFSFPLVVDPVMISKHGAPLLDVRAQQAMPALIARATLLTPNAPEAAALLGTPVENVEQARSAARAIAEELGATAVLVKGGHLQGDRAIDVLFIDGGCVELSAERIDTRHTHGTGCTYSAAITARLAQGHSLGEAVQGAKRWLTEAIRTAPGVGQGVGPVNHWAPLD